MLVAVAVVRMCMRVQVAQEAAVQVQLRVVHK
jgi:hypothetical protein